VREHFGDPEEVKAMLVDVHAGAMNVSMMRRIAVITVISICIYCMIMLGSFVLYAFMHAFHFRMAHSHDPVFIQIARLIPWVVPYACAFVMLIVWRNREHGSRLPWYMRSNPWYFAFPAFFLFCLMGFCVLFVMAKSSSFSIFWGSGIPEYPFGLFGVIEGVMWIWWLTGTNGNTIGFFAGLLGWSFFKYGMNSFMGSVLAVFNHDQLFEVLPRLLDPRKIVDPYVMTMSITAAVLYLIFYGMRAVGEKAANSIHLPH